jgi:hypothetical protein
MDRINYAGRSNRLTELAALSAKRSDVGSRPYEIDGEKS